MPVNYIPAYAFRYLIIFICNEMMQSIKSQSIIRPVNFCGKKNNIIFQALLRYYYVILQ